MPLFKDLPIDRMVFGALAGAALTSGKLPKGIGSEALAQFLKPLATNDRAVDMIAAAMAREESSDKKSFAWESLDREERETWRKRAKVALRAFTVLAAHAATGAAKKTATKKSNG